MEASTGTFNIARAMNKLPGVLVCVVNPHSTRINETKKKTDKEDSLVSGKTHITNPGRGVAAGKTSRVIRRWKTVRSFPITGRLTTGIPRW